MGLAGLGFSDSTGRPDRAGADHIWQDCDSAVVVGAVVARGHSTGAAHSSALTYQRF